VLTRLIRPDRTLAYCTVWTNQLKLIVHAGRVGDTAPRRESATANEAELRAAFEQAISSARAQGFRDVRETDLIDLILQHADATMDADERLDHRRLLEFRANESLGAVGVGYCTGGDIGPRRANVWCKVLDPEVAAEAIVSDLESLGLDEDIVIARRGTHGYEVLYPLTDAKPFQL
jgi:hypothetical protein